MPEGALNGSAFLSSKDVDALSSLRRSRYGAAAAATLYVYDILITFDIEVEHIWRRFAFNLSMLFYILNRYISFVFFIIVVYGISDIHGSLSTTFCRAPFFTLGLIIAHAAWTGVMTLRVSALWKQRTRLVTIIWILWTLTNIIVIICSSLSYIPQLQNLYFDYLNLCSVEGPPSTLQVAGHYAPIANAILETLLAALTIIKAFDFEFKPSFSFLPLFYRVLARDGVLYYVVSVVITVATLASWFTRPDAEQLLFGLIYWSLLSTVISRLALNLRQTYYEEPDYSMKTMSFGIPNIDATTEGIFATRMTGPQSAGADADADAEGASPTISEPDEEEMEEDR